MRRFSKAFPWKRHFERIDRVSSAVAFRDDCSSNGISNFSWLSCSRPSSSYRTDCLDWNWNRRNRRRFRCREIGAFHSDCIESADRQWFWIIWCVWMTRMHATGSAARSALQLRRLRLALAFAFDRTNAIENGTFVISSWCRSAACVSVCRGRCRARPATNKPAPASTRRHAWISNRFRSRLPLYINHRRSPSRSNANRFRAIDIRRHARTAAAAQSRTHLSSTANCSSRCARMRQYSFSIFDCYCPHPIHCPDNHWHQFDTDSLHWKLFACCRLFDWFAHLFRPNFVRRPWKISNCRHRLQLIWRRP